MTKTKKAIVPKNLLNDLRGMISEVRQGVAQAVNSALVMLYWQIGKRIQQDILKQKRAEYGKEIITALGRELTMEFGQGFSRRNLFKWFDLPKFTLSQKLCTQCVHN